MLALVLLAQITLSPPAVVSDSEPPIWSPRFGISLADTVRRRPRAIEIGPMYATRLKIHRIASFTMYPLFAAEYWSGSKIYNARQAGLRPSGLSESLHTPLAVGIGGLFAVNTVTGTWNLWESRKDPAGRTRRMVHSIMMLASDAGFLATAISANSAKQDNRLGTVGSAATGRNRHRNLAIASISVSLVGNVMMLIWK